MKAFTEANKAILLITAIIFGVYIIIMGATAIAEKYSEYKATQQGNADNVCIEFRI